MKTLVLFKSSLLSALLFLCFQSAHARVFFIGETQVGITTTTDNSRLNIKIANIGAEALILTVYNKDQEVLFEESFKGAGQFNKTYDLHKFPDGEYIISFRKPLLETVQPFTIDNDIVFVADESRLYKFMPKIRVQGNQLKVNLALNDFSALQLYIYDKYGRQLLTDEVEKSISFNGQYDLSKIEPGQYTVEIRSSSEIFRKNFEVK
jgi:hypothetical protein